MLDELGLSQIHQFIGRLRLVPELIGDSLLLRKRLLHPWLAARCWPMFGDMWYRTMTIIVDNCSLLVIMPYSKPAALILDHVVVWFSTVIIPCIMIIMVVEWLSTLSTVCKCKIIYSERTIFGMDILILYRQPQTRGTQEAKGCLDGSRLACCRIWIEPELCEFLPRFQWFGKATKSWFIVANSQQNRRFQAYLQ